jgi:poly-gamma-glutamate synthesis protein (capsule biosynthesis protein)
MQQTHAVPGPEFVIAAVGDIMMPLSIQNAVARNGNQYDILFEKVIKDLQADIIFANLETPVDDRLPVSGYPRFNARPELLAAMKKAGIGVVSVANNHALDAGPNGLIRTLDNIDKAGIVFTGAGRIKTESDRATMVTVSGITTAFFAYTYGTNEGMPRKKKGMPAVNILRADSDADLALAASHIRKARASADLVVVSLHWSDEYRANPTPWQRRAARGLIEAGADVILGHHPHVLQPIESYTAPDGRVGLIAFSLGNFISSQNYGISNRNKADVRALRGDGIILMIHVRREKGRVSVIRTEFLPIWTARQKAGNTIVFRPVCIAREIALLGEKRKRSVEEDNTLALLRYRQKIITDQLTKR